MACREKIAHGATHVVRYRHPTDEENLEPLDNTEEGATAFFKVMDPSKYGVLTEGEPSLETTLAVTNAGAFEVGDAVDVELDDGTVDEDVVVAVDPVAGTIDVSGGLASGASEGRRARVRLGSSVPMTEYGTPKLGTVDWGFRGTLSPTHPGLSVGKEIDVEIWFDGGTASLKDLKVLCLQVASLEDCEDC